MTPATNFQIPKTLLDHSESLDHLQLEVEDALLVHNESLDHCTWLMAGGSRHTVNCQLGGAQGAPHQDILLLLTSCCFRTIPSKLCANTCTAKQHHLPPGQSNQKVGLRYWMRSERFSDGRCVQKPAIQLNITFQSTSFVISFLLRLVVGLTCVPLDIGCK